MTLDRLPTQEELRARRPPVAPLVFLEAPLPADDACPDDPDGLHHSGCGCPDVDPLNP